MLLESWQQSSALMQVQQNLRLPLLCVTEIKTQLRPLWNIRDSEPVLQQSSYSEVSALVLTDVWDWETAKQHVLMAQSKCATVLPLLTEKCA